MELNFFCGHKLVDIFAFLVITIEGSIIFYVLHFQILLDQSSNFLDLFELQLELSTVILHHFKVPFILFLFDLINLVRNQSVVDRLVGWLKLPLNLILFPSLFNFCSQVLRNFEQRNTLFEISK